MIGTKCNQLPPRGILATHTYRSNDRVNLNITAVGPQRKEILIASLTLSPVLNIFLNPSHSTSVLHNTTQTIGIQLRCLHNNSKASKTLIIMAILGVESNKVEVRIVRNQLGTYFDE
jgi:hypothetical protein